MNLIAQYGQTLTFTVTLVTRGTADYASNPAINAGDVKVISDTEAIANINTLPTASGVVVSVTLSATEMSCAHLKVLFVSQTNPKPWDDYEVNVTTCGNASA